MWRGERGETRRHVYKGKCCNLMCKLRFIFTPEPMKSCRLLLSIFVINNLELLFGRTGPVGDFCVWNATVKEGAVRLHVNGSIKRQLVIVMGWKQSKVVTWFKYSWETLSFYFHFVFWGWLIKMEPNKIAHNTHVITHMNLIVRDKKGGTNEISNTFCLTFCFPLLATHRPLSGVDEIKWVPWVCLAEAGRRGFVPRTEDGK